MVERLDLEDPYRLTCHAHVTASHAGGAVELDRTVFNPGSRFHGHAQPEDRGYFLSEGHKLKIAGIKARGGRIMHVLHGPTPAKGAKCVLHLDRERRLLTMRTHAALHLVEAALSRRRVAGHPGEVRGGGVFRTAAPWRSGPPEWAQLLKEVNGAIDAALPVLSKWLPRDDAGARPFRAFVEASAVSPGEPVLRIVEIGEGDALASRAACAGTLVKNTREIGRVGLRDARIGADGGVRFVFQVSPT